jgi:AsmA protein
VGAGEPPARAKAPEGKPAPKSERVQLNVAGIEVKASSMSWTDESTGNRFRGTLDRLETGRIASGVPGKLSLAMRLEATQPKADYKVDLSGQYLLNLEKQSYALSGMELRVADAAPDSKKPPLTLKGDVEFDASPQAIRFTLVADQVNLDRYLPPPDKKKAPAGGGTAKTEPEQPIDLSGLKGLNMKGDLKIGQLIASNVKLENVHLGVKAAGGKVVAEPLTADLYQGKLSGAASVDANTNHFAMKSDLTGVALGLLLKDALDNDMLEGKGNVALDVQTSGNFVSAMKKALAGTASLNMKDAALKGVNLQEEIEKAKAMLRSKSAPPQAAQASGRTDLSEVSASFVIRNGVAHNDDLAAKAPLFRLSGAGDVNIGANTIDYLAKVSIVASTAGQGGKDVGDLSGATIPVKIGGALDDPKISVDWNAFLRDTGKQLLQKQGKEQLKKQEDKLKERLQDRLKNFLGR